MQVQYGTDAFNLQYAYSNRMFVSQMLCRLEPYTKMNLIYSDQSRDERIPIGFEESYETVLKNLQSNNELTPELYYFPEILMNMNKLKLSKTSDYQLDSIYLPKWAMSYHDFVRNMREQLESKYV